MSITRVTNGPMNAQGTDPQDQQALILDVQNSFLETAGNDHTRRGLYSTLQTWRALAALTAITTAQTLFSRAFNAGALAVLNRTLKVKCRIVYATTSTNVATLSFAITLGGVTLCTITTAATNTAASTNLPVDFEFELNVAQVSGIYGIVTCHGSVKADIGTAAATAIAEYLDTNLDLQDTLTVATNPTAGETIMVNGTLVTFIVNGGTPVGNQVALGTTAAGTATALYTFLAASTDVNIAKATWTNPSSAVVLGVSNTAGFVPWAIASVPAHITTTVPVVNVSGTATLAATIAASAAVPSAQVQYAKVDYAA